MDYFLCYFAGNFIIGSIIKRQHQKVNIFFGDLLFTLKYFFYFLLPEGLEHYEVLVNIFPDYGSALGCVFVLSMER